MQVGNGDIAPRLLNLFTGLKYVFTSHLAPSTLGGNRPHLLKTMLVGPKNNEGLSAVHVNWNTIRRSANPHPTPADGVNRLPAIPAIPPVQAELRATSRGVCGGHNNNQRIVSLRTQNFPSVSFHEVSLRVLHSSTSATIKYNFAIQKVIKKYLFLSRPRARAPTLLISERNFKYLFIYPGH